MLLSKQNKHVSNKWLSFVLTCIAIFCSNTLFAKGAEGPPPESSMGNPLAITLVIIILILLLAIALLANVLSGAMAVYGNKMKKEKSSTTSTIVSILAFLALSLPAMAQTKTAAEAAPVVATNYGGLSATAFYFLVAVVCVELIVILALLFNLKLVLGIERKRSAVAEIAEDYSTPKITWWDKFNSFKPVTEEASIDLGHDYDGIRELDNRLPPWWLYGFYCTILVGAIYLWRYHVAHTAPLSGEEYSISVQRAAEQQEAYLKSAANKVDETTVTLLTKESDLAAGKNVFITVCSACHGKAGEGGVGPNLTDDYWIHGGKINDIFKTIKYGYQEKGMRSWKDDYSPVQIAQISSYVKSLHGTNPPNGKEKQGDLYVESATTTGTTKDSATVKKDSVTIAKPDSTKK